MRAGWVMGRIVGNAPQAASPFVGRRTRAYPGRIDQVIQIAGALMILAAFAAAQFGMLDQSSRVYLVLNLVGSAILAVLAYAEEQLGFLLLEVVWALVSAWSLWQLSRSRRRRRPAPC
jgi:Flp pilus assembly protein TadB